MSSITGTPLKGKLWIVATPLGNMEDLSPRAAGILGNVDLILCEDTRRAGIFLKEGGIRPKRLESFFEHNEAEKLPMALACLRNGGSVALVTDAGTPLVSDPGYRLVKKCREEDLPVSPVPGPSAPIAALSAAGLPPVPFSFLGFPPRGAAEIRRLFAAFEGVPGSVVFFERKNRLKETLRLIYETLGERRFVICRELTKTHEEFIRGQLSAWDEVSDNLLGEITVVLSPKEDNSRTAREEALRVFAKLAETGRKPREVAKMAAAAVSGWTASEIYNLARRKNGDQEK